MMTIDNFEIFTLPSGLRCLVRSFDGPSFCQVCIDAGSRDDFPHLPGMAHFVEHTVFRGTGKRTGWQINARVEDVGGALNAYTSRETTVYYTVTPASELHRGLELLADFVGNASFPEPELLKEKTIIHEEIKSDIDSPEEAIFDEAASLTFADSQLAHNILGTYESVSAMNPDDARRFVKNLYTPKNMVLSVVADMPVSKIRKMVEKYMSVIPQARTQSERIKAPDAKQYFEVREKGLEQSHTILSSRIFSCFDERRFAMTLLRYYLGSGMNSLFMRELREKRGLVYSLEVSTNLYTDAGCFYVYFGSAKENEEKCRRLIEKLLVKMAENPMKPGTFDRLRRNYAGRTEILNSAINKRAGAAARELLRYNTVTSRAERKEQLYAISPEQLRQCAEEILRPGLSAMIYR